MSYFRVEYWICNFCDHEQEGGPFHAAHYDVFDELAEEKTWEILKTKGWSGSSRNPKCPQCSKIALD